MAVDPVTRTVRADVIPSGESLANRLRRRRREIETGEAIEEATATQMQDVEEPEPNRDDRRGYTRERW